MSEDPRGELATLVRGAAPFAGLSDEALANVLEMLAGRYPSDEFGELRRSVGDRCEAAVLPVLSAPQPRVGAAASYLARSASRSLFGARSVPSARCSPSGSM